ncbi:MAG: DNA mismatch repair protein MutS, partial [Clostridia bacterium]|nr:DNA mismatch repair protein MutS [Clostridia bacterium]
RRGVDERIKRDGLTDELSALRTRLAAEQEDAEQEARGRLCAGLKAYAPPLLENAVSIGRLDYALAKARLAATLGAVMPKVGGARFDMRGMTNPKFAAALAGKGRGFVPVSLELDEGSTVITGANMGGKSIAIKTLALNVQLAMCGFAVFAEAAELPFIENIALLSEDREDALSGLSSFGGEMRAFDTILKETDGMRSLVLLDEFARGTNPHEGAALVRAAVRLFNRRKGCYAVVATHFDGIARLASRHYQVAGLRNADPAAIRAKVATGTGSLADFMDYGLYPVAPDEEPPRDAITIIHALGVTSEFTDLIDI